jgi:hypothetical protein
MNGIAVTGEALVGMLFDHINDNLSHTTLPL